MKQYHLTPQERDNFCVCSILQAVLKKHGTEIAQREISQNLTPSQKGFYVDDEKIKNFLLTKGLEYNFYPHNQIPFNEPDTLLHEVDNGTDILVLYDVHGYLVLDFKDPELELLDPKDVSAHKNNIQDLIRIMFKNNGGFGLISLLSPTL